MSVSIKVIAKEAGVSPSTVSRVLNNIDGISEETRKLVRSVAEDYGYVPNMVARSLLTNKTNTIGFVIPDIGETYFSRIIKGLDKKLSEGGYTMILCDSGENPEKEQHLIQTLYEKRVDGLIIASVQNDEQTSQIAARLKDVPVVFIDNMPNTLFDFNAVTLDNVKASYLAVEHLYKLGHRKIAAIFGKRNESTGLDRYEGFLRACESFNLSINERQIRFGDFKEKSGYEATLALLSECPDMTAFYVTSSQMTYGAILAIKERGLSMPDDISLVGFDIREENRIFNPSITTILQPEQHIGEVVADLLFDMIEGKSKREYNQKIMLPPTLSAMQSTQAILTEQKST